MLIKNLLKMLFIISYHLNQCLVTDHIYQSTKQGKNQEEESQPREVSIEK